MDDLCWKEVLEDVGQFLQSNKGRADIDNNRRDSISICPNNEIYLLSIVDNRHLRSKKLGAVIMWKEEKHAAMRDISDNIQPKLVKVAN